jgi:stress response protein YsnF
MLAGCYNPEKDTSSSYYHSSAYTGDSGLTYSDTSSTRYQDQGAPGSQTYQTTGTGEIQSERMVIPLHEEQVQVGKRTVETGTVRLRKQITTETINQPVQIRKETIVVDREPTGGTSTSQSFQSSSTQGQQFQQGQTQTQSGSIAQPFEQGEIVVRLHSEEPVIEKRIVPAGNVVVETRVNNEQVNVQQQIRREKIDVDKGNAQNVIVSENLNQQTTGTHTGAPAPEPQRYHQPAPTSDPDLRYRAPVTTREYEPFPRPQPDGRETFPELNKNPQGD